MKVDKLKRKISLLEDICTVKTGRKDANHADDNGCYPFFTCGTNPLKSNTYSFEGANLIVPGNGDIGRCFYYNGKIEAYQRTYVIHLKDNSNIDIKYLYSIFKACWKPYIKNKILGAAMPYIKLSHLNTFPIPIYDLDIQLSIASELDAIQEMIDGYKAQIADLDELAKSIFLDMFGDPITNPKGWKVKKLHELVKESCALTYGIVQPGDEYPNGVPVVRSIDMSSSIIQLSKLKKVAPSIAEKFKRTTLVGDEIFISCRGVTGMVSLASPELKGGNITRGLVSVRLKIGEKYFVYYCIKMPQLNDLIQSQTKGATLSQINVKDIRLLPIIFPPLSLQQHFATQVEAIELQKELLRQQLADAETLMAERMQYYFS